MKCFDSGRPEITPGEKWRLGSGWLLASRLIWYMCLLEQRMIGFITCFVLCLFAVRTKPWDLSRAELRIPVLFQELSLDILPV